MKVYLKHTMSVCILIIFCSNVIKIESARILVVIPTASLSHQIEIRPFTQELAKRGHEVVVITTDPAFPEGKTPANLTEIDIKEAGYAAKNLGFAEFAKGHKDDIYAQIIAFHRLFHTMFEAEINTEEVQALIKDRNQYFDLVILEACVRPALIFSHIYKAPIILFSSLASFDMLNEYAGPMMHPLIYPTVFHQRTNNLTLWEKVQELYKHYLFETSIAGLEVEGDEVLRRNFGNDIPPLKELKKNVDMLFYTQYHIWDSNRPVPPGIIYLGGISPTKSTEELPKDLQSYLDSSAHGIIYMSFGTNVNCSLLPAQAVQSFVKAFAQLPYDVLLKWNSDKLPEATKNVKLFRWLPQIDILRHPQVKLFISQGGLQSSSEAISAGVPLLGIPMLADQWYNVEQYVRLKIGLTLDIETITPESMLTAIKTILKDDSYRRNIVSFRNIHLDQPQTALDRAVWWAEHVIRHKGARHLRAPTALISYWEYYEVDLVLTIAACFLLTFTVLTIVLYKAMLFCLRKSTLLKFKNEQSKYVNVHT